MVRACEFCRKRKIKCDSMKPICSPCCRNNRSCIYDNGPQKQRPSAALIRSLKSEKAAMEDTLVRLKAAGNVERHALLDSLMVTNGRISISNRATTASPARPSRGRCPDPRHSLSPAQQQQNMRRQEPETSKPLQPTQAVQPTIAAAADTNIGDMDDNYDAGHLPDIDDGRYYTGSSGDDVQDDGTDRYAINSQGRPDSDTLFSSTSVMRVGSSAQAMAPNIPRREPVPEAAAPESLRYQLIANAALERQREHQLRLRATIRGIPADLALHLLDLHWSRQHHTFLLTYRPTFMRELIDGGPYCSDLLLYAVFACSSKFSERLEVRDDPGDPATAGQRFFVRCDELLLREGGIVQSQIPTIIALIMLGSTFIARGKTSKGWLYTGYAMRMVYDIGLHVDSHEVNALNIEEVEIRRRVFWGAFVCEKLQSLYLGRPPTIRLQDAVVSDNFLDTFEELELWEPYRDPLIPDMSHTFMSSGPPPAYSVSVFQQLCLLSKIMTRIINDIYFVGATEWKTLNEVNPLEDALQAWYLNLPSHLAYEPWTKGPMQSSAAVAPNRIILLTTYFSLVILLHRPFIATLAGSSSSGTHTSTAATNENGNDQSIRMSAYSWKRCTTAARNITSLVLSYRSIYPLRKSNYLLSYAVYVACTIHVLNVAALSSEGDESAHAQLSSLLAASLGCLDELAVPNSGAADTARIIRNLMAAKGVQELPMPAEFQTSAASQPSGDVWQFSNASPTYDDLAHMQPFQDVHVPGQGLLFGFMDENMSLPTLGIDDSGF